VIVLFFIIWAIFGVVDTGAGFLIAYDFFRVRGQISRYWIAALLAGAGYSLALVIGAVLLRRGASAISHYVGLWMIFLFQGAKAATMGALALHMRGNLGNPKPKQTTEE